MLMSRKRNTKKRNVSADDGMCRQSDNRRRHLAGCFRVWNRPHVHVHGTKNRRQKMESIYGPFTIGNYRRVYVP